ncbi:MAG: NFACT family protein [Clostridiales bacterium]|nr:NFACT family protein [Clostridiales bacterium]
MAFDGTVIAALVKELNETILNTKINKIAQPEGDELLLTLKGNGAQYRLALSASASLPFLYLTEENKQSPLTAPAFCMLLRKHIAGGRIIGVTQPGMERIINFRIEHLDEMGDLCIKTLVVELMGKHSNIIFCAQDGTIIDSIKRVSSAVSSVREVLPGKPYAIAATQEDKKNPLTIGEGELFALMGKSPTTVCKAIYGTLTGVSPVIANEIAYRAGIDGEQPVASYSEDEIRHLCHQVRIFFDDINDGKFTPVIVRKGNEPIEFSAVELSMYRDCEVQSYESISRVLEVYYAEKNVYTRIRQKSADLRRIVSTALERCAKKYDLQMKQLRDSEKREKYRLYGEMIQSFGYGLPEGSKELVAKNYYDENKEIKVPLDPTLTPQENAQKYFEKYGKLKRTAEALSKLTEETKATLDHLESIQTSLDIARSADDLVQIREELVEYGFIKKGRGGKKEKVKSRPFHYVSSDGYDMYVGKNNYQNDELTFKFATGNDWWFHAKKIPGSHVVVKSKDGEMPDRVFEEAGSLAAYYSKGRDSEKLEVDYLQKKNVKKPAGAAPGFVVYYTNFSLVARPDISNLKLVEDAPAPKQ